ncbi:hypothetical protein DP117_23050 [Brasilonema sp. UFV-L1]|nr:hypothetical protein [Brasilonema sp. UFV-L1]
MLKVLSLSLNHDHGQIQSMPAAYFEFVSSVPQAANERINRRTQESGARIQNEFFRLADEYGVAHPHRLQGSQRRGRVSRLEASGVVYNWLGFKSPSN